MITRNKGADGKLVSQSYTVNSENPKSAKFIYGSFYYGAWEVNYYSVKNGLIGYTVKWNQARYNRLVSGAAAVALIVVMCVCIYSTGGISIPVCVPAITMALQGINNCYA